MEEQNRFFDVFPDLHLEGTVVPLFEGVRVRRVVTNAARTRLRIMVTSENWIKKKHIRKVENAIKSQLFKGQEMDARIIEKFDLPSVWTPSLFFDAYRSSMEYELREVSPLMLQAFLHSAIEFDEGGALITVEENPIYKWEEERLVAYIGKIFRDRAGFADFEVRVAHVSAGPASFDDDLYLAEAAHTESAAEEKAEKKGDYFWLNPGSVALPKEGNPKTYAVIEGRHIEIKTLDGEVFKVFDF